MLPPSCVGLAVLLLVNFAICTKGLEFFGLAVFGIYILRVLQLWPCLKVLFQVFFTITATECLMEALQELISQVQQMNADPLLKIPAVFLLVAIGPTCLLLLVLPYFVAWTSLPRHEAAPRDATEP